MHGQAGRRVPGRRKADHVVDARARRQPIRQGCRRRADIDSEREGPQHAAEALLELVDRAPEQEIRVTALQRAREPAADERAIEDERSGH